MTFSMTPFRGEIVGADFDPGDCPGRIVVHVAAPDDTRVGHSKVVVLAAEDYERLDRLDTVKVRALADDGTLTDADLLGLLVERGALAETQMTDGGFSLYRWEGGA